MANFKKLLFLIMISAIFIALLVWTIVSFDVRNPFFAFLLNWLIMSWMAMMGQVVPLPSLPSTYHEIKPFEQTGGVYEWKKSRDLSKDIQALHISGWPGSAHAR